MLALHAEEINPKTFAEMCLSAFYTAVGFFQRQFTGLDQIYI